MPDKTAECVLLGNGGKISVFASLLRGAYKLSGAKKAFRLPETEIRKVIEKQNRNRGVFTPSDRKAYYETITVNGFPCLIVREKPEPSERAILYFFGGGMVISPDKGDLPVMRMLMRDTGCDVWFPFYPLCMEHCITETYGMVYECYRRMIELYGALPDFEAACKRANVPYAAFARPKMVHCYCMLPYFKEAREDFARITDILKE